MSGTGSGADPAARARAAEWLALVDAGDAAGSYAEAGESLRTAIAVERWAEKLREARGPLGPVTSRALAVEQQLDALPGAPPGPYLVQQYHAVYDARQAVVETLTLQAVTAAAPSGAADWRVVGYFIR